MRVLFLRSAVLLLATGLPACTQAGQGPPTDETPLPPLPIPEQIGVRVSGIVESVHGRQLDWAWLSIKAYTPDCLLPLDNVGTVELQQTSFKGNVYEGMLVASNQFLVQACAKVSLTYPVASNLPPLQINTVEETRFVQLTETGLTGRGAIMVDFSVDGRERPGSQ